MMTAAPIVPAPPSPPAGPLGEVATRLPPSTPFVAPEAIERRRGACFALRLGANESLLGPSPRAIAAARRALRQAAWYGDPESHELRERLAASTGATRGQVLVGSGIDDLLGLTVRCILNPGEVAVATEGTYPTFGYHVRAQGGRLATVPYTADFRVDVAQLVQRASQTGARIAYLANPDNPSGTLHGEAAIRALDAELPASCALFVDEAYRDYVASQAPPPAPDGRLLRFRTFSKGHGLAGVRIGYVLASEPYVRAFDKVRVQFGVNRIAQAAALASLDDVEHLAWVVAETVRERARYATLGEQLGWTAIPSSTNFVAFDVGGAREAAAWVAELEGRGVFVRRGSGPPVDRCVRVTVGTAEQRERLASVLEEAVEGRARLRSGGVHAGVRD
jgi:histidinol-phosphate aminotransferase